MQWCCDRKGVARLIGVHVRTTERLHAQQRARQRQRPRHGAGLTTEGLCRDRGVSFATRDGGFHVTTWCTVS